MIALAIFSLVLVVVAASGLMQRRVRQQEERQQQTVRQSLLAIQNLRQELAVARIESVAESVVGYRKPLRNADGSVRILSNGDIDWSEPWRLELATGGVLTTTRSGQSRRMADLGPYGWIRFSREGRSMLRVRLQAQAQPLAPTGEMPMTLLLRASFNL